jgi:hypothetical protein
VSSEGYGPAPTGEGRCGGTGPVVASRGRGRRPVDGERGDGDEDGERGDDAPQQRPLPLPAAPAGVSGAAATTMGSRGRGGAGRRTVGGRGHGRQDCAHDVMGPGSEDNETVTPDRG